MSNRMTKTGSSANRNRCIMERSITIPGLNLLITPKEQHGPCSAPNIALAIADATGFLERKPEHGRVLVFSLENTRKKTEQMLIQYNAGIGDITGLYTYKKGIFGNRIQEGLNMFLQDNTRTKMIVVDSLEKIATLPVEKIFPAHHSLDIKPEILIRMREAFRNLKVDGKLYHGSGTFDYGDWGVWL